MTTLIRTLIFGIVIYGGLGTDLALAKLLPPLKPRIEVTADDLAVGDLIPVNVTVSVPATNNNVTESITLRLTGSGSARILGSSEWVVDHIVPGETQEIVASFLLTGPGDGRLNLHAEAFDGEGNSLWGRADDLFFLVVEEQVFMGNGGGLDLRAQKLNSDRLEGKLSKSEYDQEVKKLLGGEQLKFEREMNDSSGPELSPGTDTEAIVDEALITGRATYTQRTSHKNGVDVFATKLKAVGIPGARLRFYDKPANASPVELATTPAVVQTNSRGNYSVTLPGKRGNGTAVNLFVKVISEGAAAKIGPEAGGVYTFSGSARAISEAEMEFNVHVDKNSGGSSTPELLGAFSIHAGMYASYHHVAGLVSRTGVGASAQKILVKFPIIDTNNETSSFVEDGGVYIQILLSDAFDWDVYTHEYGHFVQSLNSTASTIDGDHWGNLTGFVQPAGPNNQPPARTLTKEQAIDLAWGEGWATYFGTALQAESGAGTLEIDTVGDTVYTDTEAGGKGISYGVEENRRGEVSLGEDDEITITRILWDFADAPQDGNDNVIFGVDEMWEYLLSGVKPKTLEAFRKKFDNLVPRSGGGWYSSGSPELNRAKFGRVYGDHNVGPEPVLPIRGPVTTTPPLFKWKTKGAGVSPSYNFKTFTVQFWDGDYTREYFTSPEIPTDAGSLSTDGKTAQWTPTQDEWDWITSKGALINWAVAGSHTDGTTSTGPYLGQDRSIGDPTIAFVIDITASMTEEIAGVRSALTRYILFLRSMSPTMAPLIKVMTFDDQVWHDILSQDLDKIQAEVNSMSAAGGNACPEASAEALTEAVSAVAKGGVIIFATDASPHRNYSLTMAKIYALSKGIRIVQIITGDCAPEGGVTAVGNRLTSVGTSAGPVMNPIVQASQNPGYVPSPKKAKPVQWLNNVVCPTCVPGPDTGPFVTPNILKEVGDTSIPVSSAVASYMDLATASPNGSFLYFPDVKDGDSEPFVSAVANAAMAATVPTVIMAKPVEGYQGATMDVEVLGGSTNFAASSTLTFSGTGIVVNRTTVVSPTSMIANITITAAAPVGLRDLKVMTALGGGKTESAEGTKQFRVIASTAEARLVSITPALLVRGSTNTLTIHGSKTHFSSATTSVFAGAGITIDSISVKSPRLLEVTVSVAPDAGLGFRDVKAETGAETAELLDTLAVVSSLGLPPGMPGLSSINPGRLNQGAVNLKLTVKGKNTHFANGVTVAEISGTGVTVNSVTVTNATTAVVRVNINKNATLGVRDILLATGGELAAMIGGITITPASTTPPPEPPPSQNPCNESFVTQAGNELVIKVTANGVDDTENIQCALDWAVDTGMPVVKLSASTFYISSIVIEKFNGSLQGTTTDTTMIEVLDDSIACTAMANSGRVPAAIKFIKGEPRLRYMTIRAHRSCKTNSQFLTIVHFTGDAASLTSCSNDVVFGSVDRIILDGTSRVTGPWFGILVGPESEHFNVCQGSLLGTFKLNRSALANTKYGISSSMKAAAQVDINFNDFVGHLSSVWMLDSNQSATITANQFFGDSEADIPYYGIVVASLAEAPNATRVVVNSNNFNLSSSSGRLSIGVLVQQPGKVIELSSAITNNKFVLSGDTSWGVYATDVSKTHVSANRFTGSAQGAILVSGTTPVNGWTITANSGFNKLTSSSLRDIWLRENTNRCIVGPGQGASVHDFGANNSILSTFTPSPKGFRNRVDSDLTGSFNPGESFGDYLQAARQELQLPDPVDTVHSTDAGKTGVGRVKSNSSRRAVTQAITNPCDDSFVTEASNELLIKVAPNGVDDTVNIQCALDWAVDTGMPEVRLSAATYYISSIVAEKFNGTLQGSTMNSTMVEVLDDSIACDAMTQAGQVSAAIRFIKGEPRIRYMTITANHACKSYARLGSILRFTGAPQAAGACTTDVIFGSVDRVGMDGQSVVTGPAAGVSVAPEVDPSNTCEASLLGTFKINRSFVSKAEYGVISRLKGGAQVDINFNDFLSNVFAIWLIDTNQNTTITSNQFFGGSTVDNPYFGIMIASSPKAPDATRVVVHNNIFNLSSPGGRTSVAVYEQQPGKIVNISSIITNNRFEIFGNATWGIIALDVSKTHVSANRFSGDAGGAIQVGGTTPVTGWTITANNGLKDFTSSSLRDIWLRANTSRCIVGPGQGATISNQGSNNSILSTFSPSPTSFKNRVESVTLPGPDLGGIVEIYPE